MAVEVAPTSVGFGADLDRARSAQVRPGLGQIRRSRPSVCSPIIFLHSPPFVEQSVASLHERSRGGSYVAWRVRCSHAATAPHGGRLAAQRGRAIDEAGATQTAQSDSMQLPPQSEVAVVSSSAMCVGRSVRLRRPCESLRRPFERLRCRPQRRRRRPHGLPHRRPDGQCRVVSCSDEVLRLHARPRFSHRPVSIGAASTAAESERPPHWSKLALSLGRLNVD